MLDMNLYLSNILRKGDVEIWFQVSDEASSWIEARLAEIMTL